MMNVKAISINVGKALLVSALFMFLSMLVSIADGRDAAFGPLLISFIITLIVGAFPFIFVRGKQVISLKDGFLTIVLKYIRIVLFVFCFSCFIIVFPDYVAFKVFDFIGSAVP